MKFQKMALLGFLACAVIPAQASLVLYDQDFENPNIDYFTTASWTDLNIFTGINTFYGGQQGATFAQANTVELLNVTGTNAWGTGYSDTSGQGGNLALGMLDGTTGGRGPNQNDILAVTFNTQDFDFFNWSIDVSSIGIQGNGLNFDPTGLLPSFKFSLFSEAGSGLGQGDLLGEQTVTGTVSDRNVFDWTTATGGFDVSSDADNVVTFRIDMLSGYYGALDNFRFVASDTKNDLNLPTNVSAPVSLGLFILGLLGIGSLRRSK